MVLGVRGNNMALLTKEQIEEVVHIFLNNRDTNAVVIKTAMEKWNEKQQFAQFELDWSAAPKYAVMAAINLSWLSENGCWSLGYQLATYDRPPFTPHPHAEMMAKYAEVAARRLDPWVEFEGSSDGESWEECICPISFPDCFKYRHIGDDK